MNPLVLADNDRLETERSIVKIEPSERGGKLMLTIYFEALAGGRRPTITAPIAGEAADALKLLPR